MVPSCEQDTRHSLVYLFGNYENPDFTVCKLEIILIENKLLKKKLVNRKQKREDKIDGRARNDFAIKTKKW